MKIFYTLICVICLLNITSVHGELRAGAAKVIMRPSAPGSGVIAGGSVRTVLELAGVKNILAKQLGSSNPLNNARAAADAFTRLQTFNEVSENRNLAV